MAETLIVKLRPNGIDMRSASRFLLSLCVFCAWLISAVGLAPAQQVASAQQAAPPPATGAPRAGPDRAALEEYLRYLNLWGENITVTLGEMTPSATLPGYLDLEVTASVPGASLKLEYFVSPDGARIIRGRASDRLGKTVFSTEHYPFQAEQESLGITGHPSVGPEKAPITLTVFSDFQCAFCRDEAKVLRANLPGAYPTAVRLVFVDFPLMQIHNWAKPAAMAGYCVNMQSTDAFWKYHDWVFDAQPQITAENFPAKFQSWAQTSGLDALRLQQCQQSPEAAAAVTASFQKALAMGLNSTPTLFVNGRQVAGKLEWAALKQIIDTEIDFQFKQASKQQTSQEACCSVSLPGLFPQ